MERLSRAETVSLLSKVIRAAEASLSKCRSTDFCEQGLNEAGFKAVILSSCHGLVEDGGWSLVSEEPIHVGGTERFIDILLVHNQHKVKIVLELKYISAFWLEYHEPYRNIDDKSQRDALNNTVARIGALYAENPKNLLLQRMRHPKLKRNVLAAYHVGEALEQVSSYSICQKFIDPAFIIVAVGLVGICDKIIVRVLNESLIPDERDLEKFRFEKGINLFECMIETW